MEEKTKICAKCKRELPLTMFTTNRSTKDGLQGHCRECQREYDRRRKERMKLERESAQAALRSASEIFEGHVVYRHRDLARFTHRQLLEELKARGYKWERMLEPQREILWSKI
jgi:broad-specificity NMP kinase